MSLEAHGTRDLNLLDLPHDILSSIIHFLPPKSLFAFLSTCHSLQHDSTLHTSARYWRTNTVSKFRLPVYPVISEDGEHWKQLYHRMHTDTRLYNWGSNKNGLLGDEFGPSVPWPAEITDLPFKDAVADIVCTGYFTAVLTTAGIVWTKKGSGWLQLRVPANADPGSQLRTIQQISGTRHGVVGLAESGALWFWHCNPNFGVQLIDFDIRMVRGGWSACSAIRRCQLPREEYSGILVWTILEGRIQQPPTSIPMTSPYRPDYAGEVVDWVMMSDYVLFVTRPGRVWAWHIAPYGANASQAELPVELKRSDDGEYEEVADVCGWLERFALIMRNGEVLLGTTQMLKDYLDLGTPLRFEKTPALQNTGVVKISFGDWHYHALHKDGTITSYGHEPEGCGAFGFGDVTFSVVERGFSQDIFIRPECLTNGRRVHFEPEKKAWQLDLARSYVNDDETDVSWPGDDTRYEVSEWIEERLRTWATPGNEDMIAPGDRDEQNRFCHGTCRGDCEHDATTAYLASCVAHHGGAQGESRHGTRQSNTKHDETSPAFHAISVAACGWHSAGLVLVDTAKAAEVARRYAEVQRNAAWAAAPPRLQLLNGEEMVRPSPLSSWSKASGCPRPKAVEIVRW